MTHRSASGLHASRLRLTNIPGTTQVRPGPPGTMDLTLDGPETLVKDISWEVRDGTLHITGPASEGGGGITINSGGITVRGGRGVVIGSGIVSESIYNEHTDRYRLHRLGDFGGRRRTVITTDGTSQVIVNGKVVSGPGAGEPAETGAVELAVTVPAGTGVQISGDCAGSYELGGIRGTLDLQLQGAVVVRAGVMRATRAEITGSARVTIASVLDALRADITGSGSIDAKAGEVTELDLDVTGSGRATFAGTARDADLDVTGSGRIRVDTVTGRLRRDVTGSGRIDIREQPRRARDDFWR